MSKKWWSAVFIAIVVGAVAIVLGFLLPEPDSFLKNILAEVAGLAFALALAVWLIEGPHLDSGTQTSQSHIYCCSVGCPVKRGDSPHGGKRYW